MLTFTKSLPNGIHSEGKGKHTHTPIYYKCVSNVKTNFEEMYGSRHFLNTLITERMNFAIGIEII